MAKYIKPTLTITSNKYDASNNPGPMSTPLNISVTDSLSISQVDSKIVTVAVTPEGTLFDASDYTASGTAGTDGGFVYLKNTSSTAGHHIYIGHGSATAMEDGADTTRTMTLQGGEFAFFPWDMTQDIVFDANGDYTAALEAWLFVRTGTA